MGEILHQQPGGRALLKGIDDGPVIRQSGGAVGVDTDFPPESIVQATECVLILVGGFTLEDHALRATVDSILTEE